MREIKFRAWINLKKNDHDFMVYQGQPDLETLQSFMFHWGDSKNLMQYTGIKDKNGKEIYEGDILKVNETHMILGQPDTDLDNYTENGVVEWDSEGADFQIMFDRKKDFVRGFTSGQIREVIGNIYEKLHPDCLCIRLESGAFQVLSSCPLHRPMLR